MKIEIEFPSWISADEVKGSAQRYIDSEIDKQKEKIFLAIANTANVAVKRDIAFSDAIENISSLVKEFENV